VPKGFQESVTVFTASQEVLVKIVHHLNSLYIVLVSIGKQQRASVELVGGITSTRKHQELTVEHQQLTRTSRGSTQAGARHSKRRKATKNQGSKPQLK
jgi:hypothetical protein